MASNMPLPFLDDIHYDEIECCGMCLADLSKLNDVRKLRCGHEFCFNCLAEFKQIHGFIRCASCRTDYGDVDLFTLGRRAYTVPIHFVNTSPIRAAISARPDLICGASGCNIEADSFCTGCTMLFCMEHKQTHDVILSSHKSISAAEYSKGKDFMLPALCKEHHGKTLTIACEKCYRMMCERCMDDGAGSGCNKGQEHIFKSLRYVADKARLEGKQQLKSAKALEKKFQTEIAELNTRADELASKHGKSMERIDSMIEHLKIFVDKEYAPKKSLVIKASAHNDGLVQKAKAADKHFKIVYKATQEQSEELKKSSDTQALADMEKIQTKLKELTTLSTKASKLHNSLINASTNNLYEQPVEQLEPVSYPREISLCETLEDHENTVTMFTPDGADSVHFCKSEHIELGSPTLKLKTNLQIIDACPIDDLIFVLSRTPTGQINVQFSSPAKNRVFNKALSFKPSVSTWKRGCVAVTTKLVVVALDKETELRIHQRNGFKQLQMPGICIKEIAGMAVLKSELVLVCGVTKGQEGAVALVDFGKNAATKWILRSIPSPTAMAINMEQRYVLVISDIKNPFINIMSFQGVHLQNIPIPGAVGPPGNYVAALAKGTHEMMFLQRGMGIHSFSTTKLMLALSAH